MFIILLCFVVYYGFYGNNVWKQVLDSRFTVKNCAHLLLEGWNLVQRSRYVSGLMRAESVTASGLIWSGALQNLL
jgi:hypothetical protein